MPRNARPWKRSGRGWYVWHDGRQVKLAGPKATRGQADAAWHRLCLESRPPADAPAPTAARLVDLYLDQVRRRLRPDTFRMRQESLQSFAVYLGERLRARDVKPWHVEQWLASHDAWGKTTRGIRASHARACWRWGRDQGYLAEHTLARVKPEASERRKPADRAELARALEKAPHGLRMYLEFLAETGARPGEIEHVDSDAWDGENQLRVKGKTGERIIYLSPRARRIVEQMAFENFDGPLFQTPTGRTWNRDRAGVALRRLGVKLSRYSLRHRYGTDAVRRVGLSAVAHLMGHKSIRTTHDNYVHPDAESLAKAAEDARGEG